MRKGITDLSDRQYYQDERASDRTKPIKKKSTGVVGKKGRNGMCLKPDIFIVSRTSRRKKVKTEK